MHLARDRLAFLHGYLNTYMDMTDDETDQFMKQMISIRKTYHGLIDKYYDKIRSQSGSRVAAQFYQVEYYFLNLVRVTILSEMPFFGDEDLQQ